MAEMSKCKITILKRMINHDLAEEYLNSEDEFGVCSYFHDGQEIIVERYVEIPKDFCPWAWADIRKDIEIVAVGGDPYWIKQPGTIITSCTDWFRPVIFKIERIGD